MDSGTPQTCAVSGTAWDCTARDRREPQHTPAAACRDVLATLAARCNGLTWASVSTRNGIEAASIGGAPNEKLSVIVSTVHALSDGIAAEANLGDCRRTILEAGKGRVVIRLVPGKTEDLEVAGMATPNTSLGMLLSCCATACRDVTLASPASPVP